MTRSTMIALSLLLTAAPAATLAAQDADADRDLIRQTDNGIALTDAAISGQELDNADLVDTDQPIGTVEDVILDDQGQIAFIRYHTSRFRDLDQEGVLAVSTVRLEADEAFNVDVSVDSGDPDRAMRLTPAEQTSQVLSNMLRSDVMIGNNVYDIRDVVFDRSGSAEYLLVSRMGGSFLSSGDAFAVPFDALTYEDGAFRADIRERDLRTMVVIFD